MELSSFITSLATSFFIFAILLLVFSWLSKRPGNEVIYYPSRVLKGLEPYEQGRTGRNPFSWITEALRASEDEVISMAGVDTATYLVFLSTVTWILILSGIFLLPVLIPIAVTDDSLENEKKTSNDPNNLPSFNIIDELAMGNVRAKSVRLWAFLIGTWWVSLVTYYLLWKAYKHVSDLRAAAKSSSVTLPEDYALLVRDIPPALQGQSRKDQVDAYFRKLHPGTFYKSMIITDNKQATKIWDELVKYRKKLAHAEAVFEESKTGEKGKPEGTRPECRTGFLGLIGAKVDSITHYEKKIVELESSLEVEQKDTLSEKQQTAALVFLNNKPAAIMASQTLHAQTFDSWTVEEAPEPRQLIWNNLPKNTYERQVRMLVVYGVVFLSVVFYMIPITFISAFTTLENLKKLLPFLFDQTDTGVDSMDAVGLRRFRQKYLDGGVIPSLLDLSIQTAIRNVDGLSDVGWTDLDLLDRILPYCRVHQLELVEDSTECRDLTPITDKLWKKFYMHEFGEESMNDAITTMEDMDVIYKWRDLYNAKLKLREEAKKESAKRLKQRYMELNEKKLNRQVQLTSKIPPSGKKRYWAAASSFKSPNASSTKGNLMKKSRLEFLNCNEVRNHTAIINRKKFSSQRLRAPQNSDNSRMGGSVGGSLASAPCNGNLNGRWAPQNSTNSRTGGSVTSVASSSASAPWKGKRNGRW